MQEFDVVLKLLLQHARQTLSQLTGVTIVDWLPTELPRVQNRRLDLLGRTNHGSLVQIECQSTNEAAMPLRMAEYSLGAYRLYGEFPLQIVLYVGRDPLRMRDRLPKPFHSFRYTLVGLRTVDSGPLLESAETSDNVLSILTQLPEQGQAVTHIVRRIAEEPESEQRMFYLNALLLLAGLRGLEDKVEEEARRMPVFYDILENKVLGREYKRGHQEGRQEGLQEGLQEGERSLLRRLLTQRFGPLPEWAGQRLAQLSERELEDLSSHLFEAQDLGELLQQRD